MSNQCSPINYRQFIEEIPPSIGSSNSLVVPDMNLEQLKKNPREYIHVSSTTTSRQLLLRCTTKRHPWRSPAAPKAATFGSLSVSASNPLLGCRSKC